jgi:hypothetical protein
VAAIAFAADAAQPESVASIESVDDAAKAWEYAGDAFTGCSRLPLANRAILNRLGYKGGYE